MTKLEAFIKSHKLKPVRIAFEADYSRQHLLRIRKGEMEPSRHCIKAIVAACQRLLHKPVRAAELFDVEEE